MWRGYAATPKVSQKSMAGSHISRIPCSAFRFAISGRLCRIARKQDIPSDCVASCKMNMNIPTVPCTHSIPSNTIVNFFAMVFIIQCTFLKGDTINSSRSLVSSVILNASSSAVSSMSSNLYCGYSFLCMKLSNCHCSPSERNRCIGGRFRVSVSLSFVA